MAELILHYGLAFVFANVLLERIGLPLPATPAVLFAAALAANGIFSVGSLFVVAFVACMLGDAAWYAAGWYYGRRVISMLCRISLSPDSCVRQTETRFERWGALTLVIAKFVPGLSTVVRPLAGTLHMDWRSFAFLNGLGSALWVGAAIWVGVLFHQQIGAVLLRIREFGPLAFGVVCAVAAGYVAYKWGERRRFAGALRVARINVEELQRLIQDAQVPAKAPVIVDLRSSLGRQQDPRSIPGAVAMGLDDIPARLTELPVDREIVFYCACPHEASAAVATRKLMDLGYTRVRPLLGGLDAWALADRDRRITVTLEPAAAVRTELH
jgi:membrane protein DedA with SNARE-associated domain/rhodanese-related sulfurtransferase